MSSALGNKVIFLDKIGKVSSFLQGAMDLGGALSEVGRHSNPLRTQNDDPLQ